MRRYIEQRVRRWWEGEGGRVGHLLMKLAAPAELLFRATAWGRNGLYASGLLRAHRVSVPVVSVGNLVVGGAGKTPVVAWLAELATAWGHTPAIVMRGYGPDEVALHRRWNPTVPVVADPDRVRGAREARREGADLILLDDGFQHRRLARDFDLVLVAAEHDLLARRLPRGAYREGLDALGRAHAVLVTRRTADEHRQALWMSRIREMYPRLPVGAVELVPAGWRSLTGSAVAAPTGPTLAVASVAAPEGFQKLVERELGHSVELRAYPDHHPFREADVAHLLRHAKGGSLVVTEKDAVKLEPWAHRLPGTRVLALRVEPGEGADAVLERIRSTLG